MNLSLFTDPIQADEVSVTLMSRTYEATLVGGSNGSFKFEEAKGDMSFGGALALTLIE